jgi:hypothetical protein
MAMAGSGIVSGNQGANAKYYQQPGYSGDVKAGIGANQGHLAAGVVKPLDAYNSNKRGSDFKKAGQ